MLGRLASTCLPTSAFSNDGLTLLKQGYGSLFLLYVALSIVLGTAAAFAGNWCGR